MTHSPKNKGPICPVSNQDILQFTDTPARMRVMDVDADNMAPTVSYGDKLIINAWDTQISANGGVYAFYDAGAVVIYRAVKKVGSTDVILSNDNPAYSSHCVDLDMLVILGRVAFFARPLT